MGQEVIPTEKQPSRQGHGRNVAREHPGFSWCNTEALKLRKAAQQPGPNPTRATSGRQDPSICRAGWQASIPRHAKVPGYRRTAEVKWRLDTKHYGDEINRSWIFRTCGYGHGTEWWKDFVSTLRMVGYDYVLSIEHEDSLMSNNEGLRKAIECLKQAIISEKVTAITWA